MPKETMVKPDCSDYSTKGEYIPVSFEPKLKWKLVKSIKYDNPKLARYIVFVAAVTPDRNITVCSHPYSYGAFSADGYDWGFGGKYFWLGTKDPEEALYLAEQAILKWCKANIASYTRIANVFEK